MSVTIGSIFTGAGYASGTSGPSKLNLYAPADSQLVVLKSGLPNVYIQLDKFAFGRCNNFFHITDTDRSNTLVRFETGSNTFVFPSNFLSTVSIASNLDITCNLSATAMLTSNLAIRTSSLLTGAASPAIFSLSNSASTSNLAFINADGVTYLRGPIGLGTSNLTANNTVTIAGNAIASGTVAGSNLRTAILTATDATVTMTMRNQLVNVIGNLNITQTLTAANFSLGSNLNFPTFVVQQYIQSPQVILTNITSNTGVPLYLVQNNTSNYAQNTISFQLTPPSRLRFVASPNSNLASNYNVASNYYSIFTSTYYHALSMNNTGLVGLGTSAPTSILDIRGDYAYYVNSNVPLVSVSSLYTSNSLTIPAQTAFLGIGTTAPASELHIRRADFPGGTCNQPVPGTLPPLLTLDNGAFSGAGNPSATDLLYGLSNGVPVFEVSATGATAIGPIAASNLVAQTAGSRPAYFLDVDGSGRFSNLETRVLTGTSNLLTIGQNTTLVIPFQLVACNIIGPNISSATLSACNLVGCNLYTPMLTSDQGSNLVRIDAARAIQTAGQFCLSSNLGDLDATAALQTTAGRLKIVAPASAVTGFPTTALGMYATGDIATMLRSQTGIAYYEAQSTSGTRNNIGRYGMDGNGRMVMAVRSAVSGDGPGNRTAPIMTLDPVATYSPILLNNYVSVTNSLFSGAGGGLGIGVFRGDTQGNTDPRYNFDMVGGTFGIRPDTGFPSSVSPNRMTFFVDANAGKVGIGTATVPPQYSLYAIQTEGYIDSNLRITSNLYTQNVETTNINFTGFLFQNGQPYNGGSQWTTSNTPTSYNIYIANSNVGIGTFTPRVPLDVIGTVRATMFEGDASGLCNLAGQLMYITGGGLRVVNQRLVVDGDLILGGRLIGGCNTQEFNGGALLPSYISQNTVTSSNLVDRSVTFSKLDPSAYNFQWMQVTTPGGGLRTTQRVIIDGDLVIGGNLISDSNTNQYTSLGILAGPIAPSVVATSNLVNGAVTIPKVDFGSNLPVFFGGSVGIGTAVPQQPLHVEGNIYASGDITAASDSNLKTDLVPIPAALDKVATLTGYTFTRRDDPRQKRLVGLLAQEVERVLPEAVYHEGTSPALSLAYGNLTALLVEAIKDLKKKNEDLEARVARLEGGTASR